MIVHVKQVMWWESISIHIETTALSLSRSQLKPYATIL